MNIEKIINIEDCFDGSYIREFVFNKDITYDFVNMIKKDGELYLYDKFPRPFFKIDIIEKCLIKGIIGNKSLKIHFYKQSDNTFNYIINKLTRKEAN
ncbi:MAG: hypothetical protein A2X12_06285 [Bacteroidetes bacterium GWE2_29_8]|nr:MAG: hypothetical protein A2X12_06285 [Bacteroidetes bacterium GWE2_29_8]